MQTAVYTLLALLAFTAAPGDGHFQEMLRAIRPRASAAKQNEAVQGVVFRLLGNEQGQRFVLEVDPKVSQNGKDTFVLSSNPNSRVYIVGSSGVAAAWGLGYYLKTYCGCHISWDGDQLQLPEAFPTVNVTITAVDTLRYYQNVCTSSYSFVWWDWPRWEREIDWMALTGVNIALASTAQEAIWQRVYEGLGLQSMDFTGPAFLAWLRMGNMRVFGGGLSNSWHDRSIILQHQILERMRALGIIAVIPTFAGFVPKSFFNVYPQAQVTNVSQWNSFGEEYCCPYLLNPIDPLFQVVARVFLREYTEEFGTDHVYNCDTFNENTPDSTDLDYLAATAEAIFNGIEEVDPNGVWLLQGWMFHYSAWSVDQARAYLSRIPIGRLLILDLQSDLTPQFQRLESFFGHAFIWCTLHNYGGQLGMYGHLDKVNTGVIDGRTFENSTMIGVGITPEGIDQNYIMYEFTLESALRSEVINMTEWVSQYVQRRYGVKNQLLDDAWQVLKDTAYSYDKDKQMRVGWSRRKGPSGYSSNTAKNIMTKLPSPSMSEIIWYNRSTTHDVLRSFVDASMQAEVANSSLYQHDLVDVTRQTIQFAVSLLYKQMMGEYRNKDLASFRNTSQQLLNILDELDTILASDKHFLLGNWIESAKQCATNENETIQYEYNARNQITLWGPNGEIRDYAAKQWAGLIADFYKPRWQVFIEAIDNVLATEGTYNATAVKEAMFTQVEKPFSNATKLYDTTPKGETIQLVNNFFRNWDEVLSGLFRQSWVKRKLLSEISVISV